MNRRPYVTSQRLAELRAQLSAGDRDLIELVGRFRLMTSGHLAQRFHGITETEKRASRRRLRRLREAGVLDVLDRRIGGVRAGSSGLIYRLGIAGQKLLEVDGRAQRAGEPGARFAYHTLAISQLYIDVWASQSDDCRLVRFDPEPWCWRTFNDRHGASVNLRPDALVELRLGDRRQLWFIEIDLATESLPTVRRKMDRYADYLKTGVEQQRQSGVFPRVLWHAPGLPDRAERLAEVARAANGPEGLHVTAGLVPEATGRGPPDD